MASSPNPINQNFIVVDFHYNGMFAPKPLVHFDPDRASVLDVDFSAFGFKYMNRQLVWDEFSEMLLLLLPLVNLSSMKNFLLPFSKDNSSGCAGDETLCPISISRIIVDLMGLVISILLLVDFILVLLMLLQLYSNSMVDLFLVLSLLPLGILLPFLARISALFSHTPKRSSGIACFYALWNITSLVNVHHAKKKKCYVCNTKEDGCWREIMNIMYRETGDICDLGPFKRLILSPLHVKGLGRSSSSGILSSVTYGADEIASSVLASITSQSKKNKGNFNRVNLDKDKGIGESSIFLHAFYYLLCHWFPLRQVPKQLNLPLQLSFYDNKGDIKKAKTPWEFIPIGHKIGTPVPLYKELMKKWSFSGLNLLAVKLTELIGLLRKKLKQKKNKSGKKEKGRSLVLVKKQKQRELLRKGK
uniref:Uncharacterized protein n=1 Tax=Lactuca sativa TaxID=4236 RepID=A0A9R1V4T4_LACSA|nr:hypothetical protein LSAT_V11C700353360 [Lactuca sativa]